MELGKAFFCLQECVVPVSDQMGKRRVLILEGAFSHFHTSTLLGTPSVPQEPKRSPIPVPPQPLAKNPNLELPSFILL